MAPENSLSEIKVDDKPSYKLDHAQTLKASNALLKHMRSEAQSKEAKSTTRNLLEDPTDSLSDTSLSISDPIWLIFTTKKHIVDQKRLKPGKISLPHSLNSAPTIRICLLTADPQRAFKDTVAHPAFPTELTPRITRIIGITKLKARYKSFESRRQLLAEHDIFLADSRIVTMLPNLLGKVFYKGPKRPMPVNFEPPKPKDPTTGKRRPKPVSSTSAELPRAVAAPGAFAHEIQRALSSTQVHLSPSPTTAVRVGLASFTPEQVAANVEAVVNGMVEKFVSKGWRNVRSVYIKGPNTLALPIWLAEELWVEETDVLEEAEAKRRVEVGKQTGKRKAREIEPSEGGKEAREVRSIEGKEVQQTETKETQPSAKRGVEVGKQTGKRKAREIESSEGGREAREVRSIEGREVRPIEEKEVQQTETKETKSSTKRKIEPSETKDREERHIKKKRKNDAGKKALKPKAIKSQ